jgi:ectoine hydroxylase-related dioxygenase (phytanoyl-CoA dioxygenase family)
MIRNGGFQPPWKLRGSESNAATNLKLMSQLLDDLNTDGFTIVSQVLSASAVIAAREACTRALECPAAATSVLADRDGAAYGARNLLQLWPGVVDLARTPKLAALLTQILGPDGGLVRGLYFDKPPGHTWALPWHRDLTIAVKQHGPLGRFNRPTTKAGVPHVEAPRDLLATMLTVRIHLDDVTEANGPLRVIPGSHKTTATRAEAILRCQAGDAILMRPILLHASGHSAEGHAEHRRTVHLEFAPRAELGEGYEWGEYVGLGEPGA